MHGNGFLKRILVISDIHGEIDLLEQLLDITQYQPKQDQLILLGDYIDRGPNSRNVLEKVIKLKEQGAFVLMGNHEELMIKAFTTDEERAWRNWIHRNGGSHTLESYGFKSSDYTVPDDIEFIKPKLHSPMLEMHLDFIMNLDHFIETDDIIFVHGGVDPITPIDQTDPSLLLWIRDVFHKGYTGDKTVIFGHTPTKYLHNDPNHQAIYFGDNNIIGIDGAAVYGGQLNCLELPSRKVYSVTKNEERESLMRDKNYEALIQNRIFVGGVDAIEDLLKDEKIDVIYDLRAEVKRPLPSEISIHQPIVDDTAGQDQSIQAAVDEVVKAYNEGKNVFFHCNTGRGRAGTIATATLMELGLAKNVEEAEQKAKEIRPTINIKPQFKEALKRIYD